MTISNNKNQREFDSLVEDAEGRTARRVTPDPHTAALFNMTVDLNNGVDISLYLTNNFNEILINNKGSFLTE